MARKTKTNNSDLINDLLMTDSADLIAGVDEAGRGPLAGPVVAAAVILDPDEPIEGLRDSKKLTEKRREELAQEIKQKALAWCVADASVEEIEDLNILQATMFAMTRAVNGLKVAPNLVLVDGNRLPHLEYPCNAIVKGDDKIPAISAASILAKTTRDQYMIEMDRRYPGYGFAQHKGYGVASHIAAIKRLGVLALHRKTFEPIAKILAEEKKRRDEEGPEQDLFSDDK